MKFLPVNVRGRGNKDHLSPATAGQWVELGIKRKNFIRVI